MPRHPASLLLLVVVSALLVPIPGRAQPTATIITDSAKGPPADAIPGITDTVEAFRTALGTDNGTDPPTGTGRREVTWDEVDDADAAPAHLPGNHFNTTIPKGIVLDGRDPSLTGIAGFMASATVPTAEVADAEFGNLNATYREAFTPFRPDEGGRLFTALGSTTLDVWFHLPGSDAPAAVRAFGAVFVDADVGSASRVEAFDVDGNLLDTAHVPAATGDGGLSFAGLSFPDPVIRRVRLTFGTDTTENGGSPNDSGQLGPGDVVVLDNFIYGEPQPLDPEPTPLQGNNPWEASTTSVAAAGAEGHARLEVNPIVSAFRGLIGGQDNATLIGTQPAGWREISLEDLDPVEHHPSHFPGDYYHQVARRGARLAAMPHDGQRPALAVAPAETITAHTPPPATFAQTPETWTASMSSLVPDGAAMVAPGGHEVEVTFMVPGSATDGVVADVGAVLADVDLPDSTIIRLYDVDGALLHTQAVPAAAGDHSLSFVGMRFARPIVHRMVVTMGDGPLGVVGESDLTQGGPSDLVALDHLIYSEPHVIREAALIGLEDTGDTLHVFNALDTMTSEERRVTGLEAGDRLVALERDQVTGTVYGVGADSNLYCLADDGAAMLVRRLEVALEGTSFGLDYDGDARRLIAMSDTGQHLSINRFVGSTEVLDPPAYATGDPEEDRAPTVTGLALGADGTGWLLDGQLLARWDGTVASSTGQLGTSLPTVTALEQTDDASLWTVSDANGPGLLEIDPEHGGTQRIGGLPEPIIGLIDDGPFGPCPPSPVAVSGEAEVEGPRVGVTLTVVNDHDVAATNVTMETTVPQAAGVVAVEHDDPQACTLTHPTLTCDFGTLAPGAQEDVVLALRISELFPEDLVVDTVVRLQEPDGPIEDADTFMLTVPPPPAGFALPDGMIGTADPAESAVALSRLRFDAADTPGGRTAAHVVVSRVDAFADSLSGSALTGDGPLLFTDGQVLAAATLQEVDRVLGGSGRVYLLGGEAALSAAVEAALVAAGYDVVRLAGPSRVETAVAVATEAQSLAGAGAGEVLLARAGAPADNPTAAWADSVTAGGYAADTGTPILLTPSGSLHPAVEAFLATQPAGRQVLLGGTAALSDTVAQAVPAPVRVSGANRAATAAAIASDLWGQPPSGERRYLVINAGMADGWAYGLAAAGLAADADAPIVAVVGDQVPPETEEAVDSCYDIPVEVVAIGSAQLTTDQLQHLDSLDTGIC